MSGQPWTPGPWELVWGEKDRGAEKGQKVLAHVYVPIPGQRYGSKSIVMSPHYVMFDGDVWQAWLQVKEPDAHLIAAAPDLAEALEELVSDLDIRGGPQWPGSPMEQRCRAALAKARGESERDAKWGRAGGGRRG